MSRRYIIRLDDACEKRDIDKWDRMEELLDKYGIQPIVGIIPNCKDPDMAKYPIDDKFWYLAQKWQEKGWIIALHGYEHVFNTNQGGINPVNNYSEFAGVSLKKQKEKIAKGIKSLENHGLIANVFFAPAHTFDRNTVEALKTCSNIRVISDTVAYDTYLGTDGMTYIPQQSGRVRKLPFRTVTFCYHPNMMNDNSFDVLDEFIQKNRKYFKKVDIIRSRRRKGLKDIVLNKLYFMRRK